MFADAGVDIIYFHPDSDSHPKKVIQKIREVGKRPGIVINPETTIESLQDYYELVDTILVMGVKPGHAGHVYLPHVDRKLEKLGRCLHTGAHEAMESAWRGRFCAGHIVTIRPQRIL